MQHFSLKPILLSLLFTTQSPLAGVFEPTDLEQAYPKLNELRLRADMTAFSSNALLQQSAFNHANYLVDNNLTGHFQNQDQFPNGFTGGRPTDRAIAAGFSSRAVSENLTTGSSNSIESLNDLFTAIYHRFGFLSFDKDTVGIGISRVDLNSKNAHAAYVYDMGSAGLNTLCASGVSADNNNAFTGVCANANQLIDVTEFENVLNQIRGHNPNIVLWPADGDTDVPPAFFEEAPDPLPDLSLSGNPLSVQFNPLSFNSVTLSTFRLFKAANNVEITDTRLLDLNTDPNSLFSPLEFALFPIQRLDWNTAYRAEISYTSDNGNDTISWTFRTLAPAASIFTTQALGDILQIPTGTSQFAVYIPPTAALASFNRFSTIFSGGFDFTVDFFDKNTFIINTNNAQIGQSATISFGNNSFTIRITDGAILPVETDIVLNPATTDNTTDTADTSNTDNTNTAPIIQPNTTPRSEYDAVQQTINLPALDILMNGQIIATLAVNMRVLIGESVKTVLIGSPIDADTLQRTAEHAHINLNTQILKIPTLHIGDGSFAVTLKMLNNPSALTFELVAVE